MKLTSTLLCCLFTATTAIAQSTTGIFYQSAQWSPDSKTICFAAVIKDSGKYEKDKWEIYSVNVNGKNLQNITQNKFGDLWPSFSRDGRKIVFQSDRNGNPDIFVMNADGTNLQQITSDTTRESYPCFSPDGKKVLFTSNRDGNEELYDVNYDGTDIRRLTNSPGNELSPSYSPDGKMITYFYEKGDHHDQVYVAQADATGAMNVSNDSLNNIYPGWANNNEIIYCAATAADGKAIVVADLKKPNIKKKLTDDIFYASISPDGSKLVGIGGAWKDAVIYVCNADGSNKRILVTKEDMIKTEH